MRWAAIGGIITCLICARLLAPRRAPFPWRIVAWGLGLQLTIGFWLLESSWGVALFERIGNAVTAFLGFANRGGEFLFGNLVKPEYRSTFGVQVALIIAPTIIFSRRSLGFCTIWVSFRGLSME